MQKCTKCQLEDNNLLDLERIGKLCRSCAADWKAEIDELMPEGLAEFLSKEVEKHDDSISFVNAILVGPCPECGSENTRDCDDTELGDITIGMCKDCAIVWCLECGKITGRGELKGCDCWA